MARIEPRDIVIGIEGDRLAAFTRPEGRRLLVRESYMLYVPYFAPPHMRLLSLIGKQDHTQPMMFGWGSLRALPFTPRVRYGRLVLATARWSVSRSEVERHKDRLRPFVEAWRARWNVPRWVYLVERDMRLLLDLDVPIALELLRENLGPTSDGFPQDAMLHFEEMLPDFDHLWLERDGEKYFHEFVAGFPAEKADVTAGAIHYAPPSRPSGPGSDWTYAKLYCGINEIDGVLASIVAPFLARLNEFGVDRWFFLRYADPDIHLRLRFHAGRGGDLMAALAGYLEPFLESGAIRRVVFDTYERESQRYGGEQAIEQAETLFCYDSRRTLDALSSGPLSWDERVAQSLAFVARFLQTWFAYFSRDHWMQSHTVTARSTRGLNWARVKQLRNLLLTAIPFEGQERAPIQRLWQLDAQGCLLADRQQLCDSFLHMHWNRLGVAPQDEARLFASIWHAWHGLEREGRLSAGVGSSLHFPEPKESILV